jgi:predicted ATPase/DNA-binding CsgD family transcriptional regulator
VSQRRQVEQDNLPAELNSFVGRRLQVEQLRVLLPSTRLLTLTGAGGVGKTRLARRVASEVLDDYPDGVWWVDLAPLSNARLVARAVAAALGIREQPRRSLVETISDALHRSKLLLILDNCEHLLTACAELLIRLLERCPRVSIIATSRERLGLPGECVWRVPTLSSPDTRSIQPASGVRHYEAVELFVDRAKLLDTTFELTDQNATHVARLCSHLDGIPLAIELAAARTEILSVDEILERLDDRFRLLTRRGRTSVPRQQTLQSAIDWSHALLSPMEQAVFRRLAVFAGGWSLDAAEFVCAGEGIRCSDVLDLLAQLVAKSLVIADTRESRVRYSSLETIRQYSRAKLSESGETERVRGAHRDWYLDLAERAGPELLGPGQLRMLDRLELEHDNLRTALQFCQLDPAGSDAAVRFVAALGRFWHWRGHVTEGCDWFARVLSRPGGTAAVRSTAYWQAAMLEWRNANNEVARGLAEQSIALGRTTDATDVLANALRYHACISLALRDVPTAEASIEECVAIARAGGHRRNLAYALGFMGFLRYLQGELRLARHLLEEAAAIARGSAEEITVSNTLVQLGGVVAAEGDLARASRIFEEALMIGRRLQFRDGIADALVGLGDVALAKGDRAAASARYREGLDNYVQAGERLPQAGVLERCGGVCVLEQDFATAARLFGAAEAASELTSASIPPRPETQHQRDLSLVKSALGEPSFAMCMNEGRALGLEGAVTLARQVFDRPPRPWPQPACTADLVLSGRERHVLRLLARGYTNRHIADELVIGVRTVETHVERILRKLSVDNRAQAMLWARDHADSVDQHANP